MGTLPNPAIQDLKVTLHDSTLIFPAQKTETKSMFLSNIDQVLNFDVQTVHFFGAHKDFPSNVVKEKLKSALSKVLVPYDFFAGRLKLDPDSGRLEINCNAAGVAFVSASTEFTLDEIGDLVYPNPAFRQLIFSSVTELGSNDHPLCIVQVTSFKCGGFVIGLSTNHCTFDGISFKIFLENLASQAADSKPLATFPCNDRHLLAARSPPRVTFPHPELLKLKIPEGPGLNSALFDSTEESQNIKDNDSIDDKVEEEVLDFKVFKLSPADVARLKEKAKEGPNLKASGFNVVTTHIWRCKALSLSSEPKEDGEEKSSTVLYAVDIRSRLKPPLPPSYTGNAVLSAYATTTRKELEEGPFWRLVEKVSEGAGRMTDEYARSAIDWGEVYKGFPHGEFLISSWWRLGFADVEYPWGKPRYSCPVVYHRKDIILFFPDIEGVTSNGVNVLVALPPKEMDKFQTLFHKFLA